MKRICTLILLGTVSLFTGCTEPAPSKPNPAPPKPAPVLEAPRPVDAGASDARKLGMMEKYEIWKAQKAADEKLAKELAEQEDARLRAFDKTKLPLHLKLLAFERKTRKELDDAAEKLKGKPDALDQIKKLAASLRKPIEAQAKILRAMDPQGGNSNIATDHDVSLNALANDYPEAIAASFQGDAKPLADVRAELDKREKKITSWLAEVKSSKK